MIATQQSDAVAASRNAAIEEAFIKSCRDEVEAPKPGNVHVFSDGHGMTVAQFLRSAEVAAAPLCAPGASVGARILGAVEATFASVGLNTNLGIILLCAPLAAAAASSGPAAAPDDAAMTREGRAGALATALGATLAGLSRDDAQSAFAAIVIASPGGLGAAARHDVRAPAQTTLLDAMREAAPRDAIARQYASGFADVFGLGLRALAAARGKGWGAPWLAVAAYLDFLAEFPDSHIARKYGIEAAEAVRDDAAPLRDGFAVCDDPADFRQNLLAFDRRLKAAGRNPGTSADLTVATLFADRLIDLDCGRQ
ncbi:triphosphoribosyl-dephospho-CoA protein [Methylocella silvestris BL2]|uniref:Triphosphoribosyl-dephospho-CoA protein n=1 Tax=Methylocella silvestris (strain DSM 15510 / CIP 108128 / LMG 27833 / NCIMB 13906 / BL2) TaxID=395965 RepID=B8EIK0_METSB|nr:triphosphoribosyl-dephospho-CoA synthase [Methylocella silvestris]ACK51319.1 triphosphoribosyl-dephospho-CoA protein [Methylocella silvestris BL2]